MVSDTKTAEEDMKCKRSNLTMIACMADIASDRGQSTGSNSSVKSGPANNRSDCDFLVEIAAVRSSRVAMRDRQVFHV